MVVSVLVRIMYPPPNMFITAMSVVSLVSLTNAGFQELKGTNMEYSKFWNKSIKKKGKLLSGRNGMLLAYTPAFLAAVASFLVFPHHGFRILLVNSALTLHFFKRIIEVLFVHKYSGYMSFETVVPISLSYFSATAIMMYAQQLSEGVEGPCIDLMWGGMVLFVIGLSGNLYHHYLLSKLRGDSEKDYKVPEGGLFDTIICPHYLFEILGFWGLSFISQTLYSYCFALGTTSYLVGRSYATRRWYLSKFEDFPNHVKALIPFVF